MLGIFKRGEFHTIGDVLTKDRNTAAREVCKQLGFNRGVLVDGPYTSIFVDETFSSLRLECSGKENEMSSCQGFHIKKLDVSVGYVDYFVCYNTDSGE